MGREKIGIRIMPAQAGAVGGLLALKIMHFHRMKYPKSLPHINTGRAIGRRRQTTRIDFL
jgi:hypothetical protein